MPEQDKIKAEFMTLMESDTFGMRVKMIAKDSVKEHIRNISTPVLGIAIPLVVFIFMSLHWQVGKLVDVVHELDKKIVKIEK